MKRKILCIILCLITLLCTVSCKQNADDVKLATAKEMQKWCERNYGDCEVGDVTIDPEGSRVFKVTDSEKGFVYNAESYVSTIWLDTVLGYEEAKRSDFESCYIDLFEREVMDRLDLSKWNATAVVLVHTDRALYDIMADDENGAKAAAETVLATMNEFDTRDFWGDARVDLYAGSDYIGFIDDEGFTGEGTENDLRLLDAAARDMHVSADDLTFVSSSVKRLSDLPVPFPVHGASILGTDNDTKDYALTVYFLYDGVEYFVADFVYDQCQNCGGTHYAGNFPLVCADIEKKAKKLTWLVDALL